MRKKGFTLMEVAVAFTIFLIAFIPILELTRGTTLTLYRRNAGTGDSSGGSNTSVQEDYTGNIVSDFLRQVERTGYTYIKGITQKTYTLVLEDGGTSNSTGCRINQYYLQENDALTKDPYDSTKKRCFAQVSEPNKNFNGKQIVMTPTAGTMKNLTTLGDSDIPELKPSGARVAPPFIYVEAKMIDPSDGNKVLGESDTIVTPFQDLCVI